MPLIAVVDTLRVDGVVPVGYCRTQTSTTFFFGQSRGVWGVFFYSIVILQPSRNVRPGMEH